jgi:hypothetical protein
MTFLRALGTFYPSNVYALLAYLSAIYAGAITVFLEHTPLPNLNTKYIGISAMLSICAIFFLAVAAEEEAKARTYLLTRLTLTSFVSMCIAQVFYLFF